MSSRIHPSRQQPASAHNSDANCCTSAVAAAHALRDFLDSVATSLEQRILARVCSSVKQQLEQHRTGSVRMVFLAADVSHFSFCIASNDSEHTARVDSDCAHHGFEAFVPNGAIVNLKQERERNLRVRQRKQ